MNEKETGKSPADIADDIRIIEKVEFCRQAGRLFRVFFAPLAAAGLLVVW